MKAINTKKLRSHLGSFWYENVYKASQSKLQKVIDTAVSSNVHSVLSRAINRLRDNSDPVEIENELVVPTWREVDINGTTWYAVGVALDFLPTSVSFKDQKLLVGLDFLVLGNGHEMAFREKPDSQSLVVDGLKHNPGNLLYSVLYGLYMRAPSGNAKFIANYLRGDHTPGAFLDALFAQAGFSRVETGGKIRSKDVHANHLVYEFDSEVVKVPYKHTELAVDSEVEAKTWIGTEGISLSTYNRNNPTWYRDHNDWSTGLNFSTMVGINGILAEDTPVTVSTSGGVTQFPFSETVAGANAAFWQRVGDRQAEYGDGSGIAQSYSDGDTVNPIDFVFSNFLDNAMIVKLDSRVIKPRAVIAMNSWIKRNAPFGYAVVVRVVDESGQELSVYDYTNSFNQMNDETLYPFDFEPPTSFLVYDDAIVTFEDVPVITSLYEYTAPDFFSDLVFVVYNSDSLGYGGSKLIYK